MFNWESDSDEELLMRFERMRRPKKIRPRINHLVDLTDDEFVRRFRLSKNTFNILLEQIREEIKSATEQNNAISPEVKLYLTLRFYATGSMLIVAGDFTGVSESSACVIIKTVTNAIAALRPLYIGLPTTDEAKLEAQIKCFELARFPKIIGAIDCTHVEIESPGGNDAEYYRNRKGWFSWNVQAICGADLQIIDVVARWPGSTHDHTIFNNSAVRARFEGNQLGDAILLGDSGYACTSYMMTPLLNPRSPAEILYNEAQIRTRNSVERMFGVWKRRFPILSLCMRVSLERSQNIIVATAVLHNIAIQQKNDLPEVEAAVHEEIQRHPRDQPQFQNVENNNNRRNRLILEYFTNLL